MKSNSPAPERILVLGMEGSGKSQAWAATAAQYRDSDSPGTFYVVNTDPAGTIERIGEQWANFADNVVWTDVRDWQTLKAATEAYRDLATSGDWIVIDSADKAWEWCRNAYEDFWATANNIKPAGMFGVVELPKDDKMWDRINAEYGSWIQPLLDMARNPAHLFSTSPAQAIRVDGLFKDANEIVEEFGRFGVRPAGQKWLAFQHHTVLLLQSRGVGQWVATTMKDRSRDAMDKAPMANFALSYLYQVAGWEL